MCRRALILDSEESALVVRRGRTERETAKKRRLAECTSASLLRGRSVGQATIRTVHNTKNKVAALNSQFGAIQPTDFMSILSTFPTNGSAVTAIAFGC
jgi:hypothetical protein